MYFLSKIKNSNGAATNSFILTFVHLVTTVLGLIVTKLLSVHFSLEEYGTYSQALMVTTTATSFSILGLTNATNYFYNRTKDENNQRMYISTIFAIQYVVGLFCAILIISLRKYIAIYFGNDKLHFILPIVAFTPFLVNLINMYQTLFVSIGKAKLIAIRNFIVSALRLVAVIFACYIVNNIVVVLFVILFLDLAQFCYFFILFSKLKKPILLRNSRVSLVKEILGFSIPMSIYVLTNSLSRDIDKYVISAFSSTESLAVYTNAAKLLPFDMITASLITVLIPIITRQINSKQYSDAKSVFKLYLRIGFVLTFIFAGGAVAVSKELMLFLYDEKYLAGLPVFIIYLFVDMIRFANVTTILSGSGKSKILMWISLTTMICNVGLNIIGYKLFGMIGPAIVTLFLTICMTIALLHFGAKVIQTTIIDLFDFKEIIIVGLEVFVFGALVFLISKYLERINVYFMIRLFICYGLYLLVLVSLNYKRAIECFKQLNKYK